MVLFCHARVSHRTVGQAWSCCNLAFLPDTQRTCPVDPSRIPEQPGVAGTSCIPRPDYAASSAAQRMVHIMNIMGLGRAAMARNAVQFQKGLSEAAFEDLYGTEAKCRELVMRWRWPNGFECPVCGGTSYSEVKTRGLFQCSACRRQTSLIAGTIFAATKVALRVWFRAMYHLTQSKQGISSIELGRRLGVTQTTAWTIKHKLAQVMMERDAEQQRPRRTR